MKPLLRVVLILNALIFLAFGLLFVLTPWAGLYEGLQLTPIHVDPAFIGLLFGIALIGLAWLAFHAAIDGALTARAARVAGHVEWLSGVVVLVWLLALHTPHVEAFGQTIAAGVGFVLVVLGVGSVRLSSAVRRRERAARAGAESAERAERSAAVKRDDVIVTPDDNAIRPSARAPAATAVDPVSGRTLTRAMDGGAVDPITGATLDPVTGRTLDPVTGREIDPLTGKRIEPVISGEIDPITGRRVDPANGAPR